MFRQQDLPQQQTHSLSRSALELLPFLCEHSAEYANGLLRVLKDPSFDLASVHWTSSKEMHKCLDEAQASYCGAHDSLYIPLCFSSIAIVLWSNMQVWEYLPVYQEDLPGHDTPVTFFAHMRKDRHTLLQDMINSPEVTQVYLDFVLPSTNPFCDPQLAVMWRQRFICFDAFCRLLT